MMKDAFLPHPEVYNAVDRCFRRWVEEDCERQGSSGSDAGVAARRSNKKGPFMVGEKHVRYTTAFGTNEDRSVFSSNDNNFRRFAGLGAAGQHYILQIYSPDPQWNVQAVSNRCFGSRHPGVCQFTMCDGSVRAVKNSTDVMTLGLLAQRNDGQVITGDY